jgi:hypothetical protein
LSVCVTALVLQTGCLTLKTEHDKLAERVTKLDAETGDRGKELDEKLAEADAKLAELQAKLDQAETLLRGSQAGIGARMDTVETEVAELRGSAENSELVASASAQAMSELREDVDKRLRTLEEKLNEATSIPEGKDELWNEADRQLQRKNYKLSRHAVADLHLALPRRPEAAGGELQGRADVPQRTRLQERPRGVLQHHPDVQRGPDRVGRAVLLGPRVRQARAVQERDRVLRGAQPPKSNASQQYQKAAKDQIDILKKDTGDLCFDREDANAGAAAKQSVQGSQSPKPGETKPETKPTKPTKPGKSK